MSTPSSSSFGVRAIRPPESFLNQSFLSSFGNLLEMADPHPDQANPLSQFKFLETLEGSPSNFLVRIGVPVQGFRFYGKKDRLRAESVAVLNGMAE
jgi:hypothetical protein